MVPTLFGITLVTFALVKLAPGDPVTLELEGGMRAGAVSRRVTDDFRHAFFLDLPLLVNLEPVDVGRRVDRLVTRLGHARERDDAVAELIRVGGAALPYLAPRIPSTTGAIKQGILDALAGIAGSCGLAGELAGAVSPEAYWAEYWDDYGADYTAARARRLVRRLVLRDDALARAEIRRLHSFAFAPLMEALQGDVTPAQAARLVDLLHEIRGTGPVFAASDDAGAQAEARAAWEEWWRREGSGYEAFGRLRRITAVITETQYAKWLGRVVTLSFGVSQRDGRPITRKLAERLPTTLLLSLLSVALAYGLAIPLGILSALRRGSRSDRVVTLILFVLYSLPVFWTATLLIQHLCGVAGPALFPLGGLESDGAEAWPWWRRGLDSAHHLVLPVICLSYVSLAVLSRYQRAAMLEVLSQDYVRTARAKGLSRFRVVVVHAARNALLPVVTLLGLQLPYMISGAVIVERIFNIPGMGLETFEAIRSHDYNWVMAVVTLSAVLTMVGILLSDVVYALVDPRVRLETRPGGRE
jgi:peptide/nickel transport system permease protein